MPGAIMHGRKVEFTTTPYAGTFTDGAKTFVEICTNTFPEIRSSRQEVEATTSCDAAKVYVPGMPEGSEFTLTGVFQGSNSGDYGTGGSTLAALAAVPAGTTVGFRDTTSQWGANDIVHRFDVVLLDISFGGGGLNDLQTWSLRARITGAINRATS